MDIKLFDPTEIKLPKRFLFVGPTNSGKSTYVKHVLNAVANQLDDIYVFSTTAFTEQWNDTARKSNIYEEWDTVLVEELLERQKERRRKKDDRKIAIVLDDLLDNDLVNVHSDRLMQKLFTSGRHYNMSLFITTQRLCGISPTIRRNCEYVCFSSILSNIKEFDCVFSEYNAGVNRADLMRLFVEWGHSYQVLIFEAVTSDRVYYVDKSSGDFSALSKFLHARKKRDQKPATNLVAATR